MESALFRECWRKCSPLLVEDVERLQKDATGVGVFRHIACHFSLGNVSSRRNSTTMSTASAPADAQSTSSRKVGSRKAVIYVLNSTEKDFMVCQRSTRLFLIDYISMREYVRPSTTSCAFHDARLYSLQSVRPAGAENVGGGFRDRCSSQIRLRALHCRLRSPQATNERLILSGIVRRVPLPLVLRLKS